MSDPRPKEHRPLRTACITVGLLVLTAVGLINASVGAHVYGARCPSIANPSFSDQFTCSFVRISLGDPTLPGSFVFTGGFWLTLIAFAIPVAGVGLLTRRAYRKAGIKE